MQIISPFHMYNFTATVHVLILRNREIVLKNDILL